MKIELCHCGKPLHYTNSRLEMIMRMLVNDFGEYVDVVVSGKTYLVPRHYIALHGLKASEIDQLGFKEKGQI